MYKKTKGGMKKDYDKTYEYLNNLQKIRKIGFIWS